MNICQNDKNCTIASPFAISFLSSFFLFFLCVMNGNVLYDIDEPMSVEGIEKERTGARERKKMTIKNE